MYKGLFRGIRPLIRCFTTQTNPHMNVLIYSGPGTTPESVKHCLETFRLLLSPYYSVASVSPETLIDQPWPSKTSLLILPGGADLPLCRAFNGEPNAKIKQYVERGGRYMGFCSGGYYASKRVEFEVGDSMEVSGSRELSFFPGICRGTVYKGFSYESEVGAKAVELAVNRQALPEYTKDTVVNYYNGGGVFVDAQEYPNTEVLASYLGAMDVEDGPGGVQAAAIYCKVGRGSAVLTGTHPEFTPDLLNEIPELPNFTQVIKTMRATQTDRLDFLRACLKKVGMTVNEKDTARPSLTPLFLTSVNPPETTQLMQKIETNVGFDIDNIINAGVDKIRLYDSVDEISKLQHKQGYEDPELAIKDLFACPNGYPDSRLTPYFNFDTFFSTLNQEYQTRGFQGEFAHLFVYGEVVTSTSVLMDQNIRLLQNLPNGFVISGTVQVCGKGRSGNYWVNPVGVLPVSTLMKLPLSSAQRSPIVFVQYLSSMAFVEAVLSYGPGYDQIPLKIKWPNDIYILLPEFIGKDIGQNIPEGSYSKVGGIVVNANVLDNQYYLVVGSGLNVSNAAPSTSINRVIEALNSYWASQGSSMRLEGLRHERLLAKYLAIFNEMFNLFKRQGFSPFLERYYEMWLHSNQIVHIKSENNARAQIAGITSDWGMLLARGVDTNNRPTGEMFQLQPDGNSFDMFKGLISKKQ